MSQIIQKFQEGGTTPTLFKWDQGGIETDRLVKAISANIDSYLDEQDWSVKRKERFVNSVNKFITGIENGNITEMSSTGKFLDSRGIEGGGVSNETGNNRFREDREAASFVKWVLNGQTPYQKPEKKVEPFDINKAFAKSFNKTYLNNTSDTFNLEALSNVSYNHRNNLIYPIFEALRNVDSENWGDYGNKQNYLAAVKNASNQYEKARKAGFKDDIDAAKTIISALSGLNINSGFLRSWFSTIDGLFSNPNQSQAQPANTTTNTTTNTSTSSEQATKESPTNTTSNNSYESLLFYPTIQNLWKIDQKTNIKLPKNRWINSKGYKQRIGPQFTGSDNYLAKLFQHVVTLDTRDWGNSAKSEYQVPQWDPQSATWKMNYQNTYKELMGDAINYMLQTNDPDLLKLNDGSVVVGSTINVKYPVCLAYNPNTKELKRVPIYLLMNEPNVSPKIKEQLVNSSTSVNVSSTPNIWSHKEGGSIKKYQTPAGPIDFDWNKYNEFIKWDGNKRYKNDKSSGTWSLIDRTENAKDTHGTGFYRTEGDSTSLETAPYFQQYLRYGLLNDKAKTSDGKSLAETWARNYIELNPEYGDKYKNVWFKDDVFDFDAFKNSKFYQGNAKVDNDKGKFLWGDGQNGIGHDVYKGKIYHIVNDKGENEFNTKEYFEGLGYYLPEDAKEEYFNNNPIVSYQTLIKKAPDSKDETPKIKKQNSSVDAILHSDKGLDFNWESWAVPFTGSILRYLNTERANKQMLNEALNSYKPYYKDPKRFERNIYGDYAALSNAENEASQINVKASNPTYSDAQIQSAKELEGEKVAASKRAEGQRAYSNRIQTTQEATLAQSKENDYNAIDTTNENRYNQWNTNMLKSQARQGYISRRTQNFNTFLQELQMQAQNRLDKKLNLDEKALDTYIKAKYSNNPELLALQKEALQWVVQGNDLNTWDTAKYNRLVNLQNKLAYEEMKFRLENTEKLYGIGVNKRLLDKIKVNSNPIQVNQGSIQYAKSGGTLSEENKMKISKMKHQLEKQKLFQKNIRESINDNSKMINNLSNTMQKLLMQVIK